MRLNAGLSLAFLIPIVACSGDPATNTSDTGASASPYGGGGAAACPSAGPFAGAPIDSPRGEWTWIDVPGAKCRDGSQTGFGIRRSTKSNKVFLFLEGGGACFNTATCATSLHSFGKLPFSAWKRSLGKVGIFDDDNAENPVRDWTAVYVPYCTGDVHAGSADGVVVDGAGDSPQYFMGFRNIGLFLQRLVPTFRGAEQVLLTGVSAGGFGAAFNYDQVATAFCPTPVALIDDSGPPMADPYLTPCLQRRWRETWRLDRTLPADCTECTGPDGGGVVNYATYLARKWPKARIGLISSVHDAAISTFFGFGSNECRLPVPLSGDKYEAGLVDLRSSYMPKTGLWGTYFVDSVMHTYLYTGMYNTKVGGTKLTDWMRDMLEGRPADIGP